MRIGLSGSLRNILRLFLISAPPCYCSMIGSILGLLWYGAFSVCLYLYASPKHEVNIRRQL